MDYETFCTKFPSEHIRAYLITKEDFACEFKKDFDRRGPVSMGMSDVVIARLLEENVITEKKKLLRKKLVLNLKLFKIDEYYERQVLKPVRDVVILPLKKLARQIQAALTAPCDIIISPNGEFSVVGDDEIKSVVIAEMNDPKDVPFVRSVIQDLKIVVSDDQVEFGRLGTLLVSEDVLLFRVKKSIPIKKLLGLSQ